MTNAAPALFCLALCLGLAACRDPDTGGPPTTDEPAAPVSSPGIRPVDADDAVGPAGADDEPRTTPPASRPRAPGSTDATRAAMADASPQALVERLGGTIDDRAIRVDLPSEVLFEFDDAELALTAQQDLEILAALIRGTDGPVSIHGETDTGGSAAYRQALSERRALAVREWLTEHGVPAQRLRSQGFAGDGPPVTGATGDAESGPRDRIAVVIGRN